MKTITIDARLINSSGIGRYIQNIIPGLISKFRIILLVNEKLVDEFVWICHIKQIKINSKIYSIKEHFELSLKIPTCDYFWSPHFNIPILPIKAKKRIVTIHDVYHLAYIQNLSLSEKIYAKILYNFAVLISDSIITVSEFTKSELEKRTLVEKGKSTVIYSGIHTNSTNKNTNFSNKYILFVGNIKPHKNLKTLVKALSYVKADLSLVIVGKEDGFINGDTEIYSLIKTFGLENRIIFTGQISDSKLVEYYRNAFLFCHPSVYEGFGFPPLEAMSYGIPTLVSYAASIPEICGDASVYFDSLNELVLASKINNLNEDESMRTELILKGYKRIKRFSWDNSIEKHIKIFES